jgi:predicted PurR-regulated permease PerM
MNFNKPIVFWIAMLASLVALVVLLHAVLLPFIAGMILAYLLDPLATRLERVGLNRLWATLTIMFFMVSAIALLLTLALPVIVHELVYFIDSFPLYVRRIHHLLSDPSRPWISKIFGEGSGLAERSIGSLGTLVNGWFGAFFISLWSGGRALVSVFSLAVVAPIVACYLLFQWNSMIAAIDNWVPPERRNTIRALAREVDDTIGGFVRGQAALCVILATFYAVVLRLIGLHHGVLIGAAAGLLSFVPYVGALSGMVVATSVAVSQFWPQWGSVLLVPAVFFVGQALGDYLLSPYLVGRRVHLNPVWMIFSLFVFGYLFGFVGLLIAVPLAAAVGVLMRFAFRQYYASPLYRGPYPAATPETSPKQLHIAEASGTRHNFREHGT